MLRIPCPVCGMRDHEEFTYLGDASLVRPPPNSNDRKTWFEYVYLRDNPQGAIREYWHHIYGCREWVIVERDTLTHEIFGAELARSRSDRPRSNGKGSGKGSGGSE
ncbi:MAG: sarcosine oxidase subunit delta [Alphaproteobacteria bacterium]